MSNAKERVPVAPDKERFKRFFANGRPHIPNGYSGAADFRTTRQIARERVAAFVKKLSSMATSARKADCNL